jgi:hypothetical protein
MKRFLIAASALGALALAATPATAQRYGRGHSSFSITVGSPYYGGYYGPSYGYGYNPYAYGYDPYAEYGYYAYQSRPGYDRYYDRSNYYDRRHHRRHRDRDDRRDRWDRDDR